MHLPDGILDTRTALLSTGAAAAGVGLALRRVVRRARRRLLEVVLRRDDGVLKASGMKVD